MKHEVDKPTFFVFYDTEKEVRVDCSMVELAAMGVEEGDRVRGDRLQEFIEVRITSAMADVLFWKIRRKAMQSSPMDSNRPPVTTFVIAKGERVTTSTLVLSIMGLQEGSVVPEHRMKEFFDVNVFAICMHVELTRAKFRKLSPR